MWIALWRQWRELQRIDVGLGIELAITDGSKAFLGEETAAEIR